MVFFVTLSVILSGGSIIDLDGTLFVQLGLFGIAFLLLRSLVFKPVVAVLDARESATVGAKELAQRVERESADKAEQFAEELRKVKAAANVEKDRLRSDGLVLERNLLDKVRKETQGVLESARVRLEDEGKTVRAELQTALPAIAESIVTKMVNRGVN